MKSRNHEYMYTDRGDTVYRFDPGRLLELYQLLKLYKKECPDSRADIEGLIEDVRLRYADTTGQPIETAHNPRKAGRKTQYDKDKAEQVKAVYMASGSVRETARQTGVSTTFVYKCIKN